MNRRFHLLDPLRFIAALAVITYHYFYFAANSIVFYIPDINYKKIIDPITTYGYLGVQIFFVISGFIILYTAIDKSATQFIKSRIIRLWPALAIGSAIAYAMYLLLGPAAHLPIISFSNFLYNFFGITITPFRPLLSNTHLQDIFSLHRLSYLKASNFEYLDGAMWTLSREVGFYIFILFIIMIKQIKHIHYLAFLWVVSSLMTFIFAKNSPNYYIQGVSLYTQMDYAAYFTLGIFSYLYFIDRSFLNLGLTNSKKCTDINNSLINKISNLTISTGLLISFLLSIYSAYDLATVYNTNKLNVADPAIASIIFFIFYMSFIFSILNKITFNNQTIKIFSIFGGASYTLYLMHQFNAYRIISYYNDKFITYQNSGLHRLGISLYSMTPWGYLQTILLLLLVIPIIIAIHIYIEKPLMRITKIILDKVLP